MNMTELQHLLGSADGQAPTSRREALRRAGRLGAGLALAALPAFLVPKLSFAQDSGGVIDSLNFALTLEFLEESFYRQGTASGVVPDGPVLAAYELIEEHEADHVDFLSAAISAAGGTPVAFTDDDFDFTAGGAFDPFGDYATFLLLSQAFEDTGVRAYKGQAPAIPRDLMVAGVNVLTAALQIHALEARHAAYVRAVRAFQMDADTARAPWILFDSNTDGTPVEAVYGAGMPPEMFPAEENTVQAGVDIAGLNGVNAAEASAAFDEPLDMETVLGIAAPFLATDDKD